jgi:hypothetical protein
VGEYNHPASFTLGKPMNGNTPATVHLHEICARRHQRLLSI